MFKPTKEQQARREMCEIKTGKRDKRKRKDKEMRIKKQEKTQKKSAATNKDKRKLICKIFIM